MDPVQARINLQADLENIADVIAAEGWTIEPWPLTSTTFFVMMQSDIDKDAYTMRLVGDDYPDQPLSIKCVTRDTHDSNDVKAWPSCEGFRPPPTADLCLSISREGLFQAHPDWMKDRRYQWSPEGNPIWHVLHSLQDRLNDPGKYHGRSK
jgi:hypothetical protein